MAKTTTAFPRFGEIHYAELPYNNGIQGGIRPVLIVQNDIGNQFSGTVEVLPLTSRILKARHMPTHVYLPPDEGNGLKRDSVILAENAVTIRKDLLMELLGRVNPDTLAEVAAARAIQSPLPY